MTPGDPVTAPPPAGVLTIMLFVPGILVNPGNARPGHWGSTYRYSYGWRQRTNAVWKVAGRPTWDGPATVMFTGYTAKLWDDAEGLHGACKAIREYSCLKSPPLRRWTGNPPCVPPLVAGV